MNFKIIQYLRYLFWAFILTIFTAEGATKPNILYIVADDLGYGDLGFQGSTDLLTPNIDALAAKGVRFTNGYVTSYFGSPTRAALLTGRYQTRFGHETNPNKNEGLPTSEKTIADRLREAGYVTGIIGKWHLGEKKGFLPQDRGFDEFYGFLQRETSYKKSGAIMRAREKVESPDCTTDAFGQEAMDFISRHKSRPWFLYLSFNAVHVPLQAKKKDMERFSSISNKKRRTYTAMAWRMDENIGQLMRLLTDLNIEKDTLIYFISDNGGNLNAGASNGPLRGQKGQLLEGGIRVPFIVSWPGTINPSIFDQIVMQIDLSVTALAAAEIDIKPEWNLDGVNLLPYIKKARRRRTPPHQAIFWRAFNQIAVRAGDYKLVTYDTRIKQSDPPALKGPELYNVNNDINETKDLAAEMPEKMIELQALWNEWNKLNIPCVFQARQ